MKKIFICFLLSSLFCRGVYAQTSAPSSNPFAHPKIKVLSQVALYGAIGGALLGTATLAFGGKPRTIAQGASLGLYAGILFGGYIVLSFMYQEPEGAPTLPFDAPPSLTPPVTYNTLPQYRLESNLEELEGKIALDPRLRVEKKWAIPLLSYSF